MTREKLDIWFDRFDKAMQRWGTSTIILAVFLAFGWMHGGPWIDAKAQSEKAIAAAYEKLVAESVKQSETGEKWQAFSERVSEEHRQHSEILREITTILRGLCDEARSKNQLAQPSTSES